MAKVKIFCEGITDQFFLSDCINIFFGIEFTKKKKSSDKWDVYFSNEYEIVDIGGCEKLKNEIVLDMLRDNTSEGGKNIVLFDADFSPEGHGEKKGTGNNGFKYACQKLNDIKKQHLVDFDFYLWHNHNDDGEIEQLLHQLIPEDKKAIFNCFNKYNCCLKETQIPNLNISDYKNELNFYLHTLNEKPGLQFRNYTNKKYWNLNLEACNDLIKLKAFLEKNLILK